MRRKSTVAKAKKATLPKIPSQLIRVAIQDAKRLDRKKYYPHHEQWHAPNLFGRDYCVVCTAGAVIAGTLGGESTQPLEPCDFDVATNERLRALDAFRQTDYITALSLLRAPSKKIDEIVDQLEPQSIEFMYYEGWKEFNRHLKEMERLADSLEKFGL